VSRIEVTELTVCLGQCTIQFCMQEVKQDCSTETLKSRSAGGGSSSG